MKRPQRKVQTALRTRCGQCLILLRAQQRGNLRLGDKRRACVSTGRMHRFLGTSLAAVWGLRFKLGSARNRSKRVDKIRHGKGRNIVTRIARKRRQSQQSTQRIAFMRVEKKRDPSHAQIALADDLIADRVDLRIRIKVADALDVANEQGLFGFDKSVVRKGLRSVADMHQGSIFVEVGWEMARVGVVLCVVSRHVSLHTKDRCRGPVHKLNQIRHHKVDFLGHIVPQDGFFQRIRLPVLLCNGLHLHIGRIHGEKRIARFRILLGAGIGKHGLHGIRMTATLDGTRGGAVCIEGGARRSRQIATTRRKFVLLCHQIGGIFPGTLGKPIGKFFHPETFSHGTRSKGSRFHFDQHPIFFPDILHGMISMPDGS
eukprot:Sdes_comp20515_c0_seq1m15066